jgi:hypothetical protein
MLEMGKLSGADIEPPEQTRLLNSCVCNAGVIGGGVPGGGFIRPHRLRMSSYTDYTFMLFWCNSQLGDMMQYGC